MAKCIKRVGIIFFAITLSFLLVVGAMLAVNTTRDNSNEVVGNNTTASATDEKATQYVDLGGSTCAEMATNWNTIIQNAKSTGKAYVRLINNWTAAPSADARETSFGDIDALSFNNGVIKIPPGMHVTIDLNGKTINRNKTKVGAGGHVLFVLGKLTITDNSYTNEDLLSTYEYISDLTCEAQMTHFKSLPIGKIMGGWTNASGGGIYTASPDAEIELNNGILMSNKSNANGGAIHLQEGNNSFTMNGGIIMGNNALANGAGVYAPEVPKVNINGGLMIGNVSGNVGGAIFGRKATINIHNTIMTGNYALQNGASVYLDGGELNMYDGLMTRNSAGHHAGGIYVCNYQYINGDNYPVTCNIYGGEISYNTSRYASGVTLYYGAKCNIKDVYLHHNSASENAAGIAVYWESTLVMDGGIISNNIVKYHTNENHGGGGVLVGRGSTMTMNGGKIIDNNVQNPLDKDVYGGGILLTNSGTNNLILNKGIISGNTSEGLGGGVCDVTSSGISAITIGSSMQIYNNTASGKSSDIRLNQNQKINFTGKLAQDCKIGIKLADDYGTGVFTTNFAASGNTNASDYFFSNNGAKIATINGGEVSFENSIESEVYDFVYLENGKRKNYKDNNLIHIVNDEQIKKQVNGGKLILGNILPNTSVNTFIQNINFDRTKVKLYDSNNKLIYDKGNSVSGVDSSLYDSRFELAVGTGWRLETYTASGAKIEEFSLSVLGDSNGDGKISASDIIYIREIASDINLYDNLDVEFKLASLILNQGVVTSADSEIILNVIDKKLAINMFY